VGRNVGPRRQKKSRGDREEGDSGDLHC
jgi:hypothetical protein